MFILSLWQEGGEEANGPPVWRASLENPRTNERSGFKRLADLLQFLQVWIDQEENDSAVSPQ